MLEDKVRNLAEKTMNGSVLCQHKLWSYFSAPVLFLDLLDLDPLVLGTDLDPSIITQK
jgi:hypothetical protein